jgi:hypothetical protein
VPSSGNKNEAELDPNPIFHTTTFGHKEQDEQSPTSALQKQHDDACRYRGPSLTESNGSELSDADASKNEYQEASTTSGDEEQDEQSTTSALQKRQDDACRSQGPILTESNGSELSDADASNNEYQEESTTSGDEEQDEQSPASALQKQHDDACRSRGPSDTKSEEWIWEGTIEIKTEPQQASAARPQALCTDETTEGANSEPIKICTVASRQGSEQEIRTTPEETMPQPVTELPERPETKLLLQPGPTVAAAPETGTLPEPTPPGKPQTGIRAQPVTKPSERPEKRKWEERRTTLSGEPVPKILRRGEPETEILPQPETKLPERPESKTLAQQGTTPPEARGPESSDPQPAGSSTKGDTSGASSSGTSSGAEREEFMWEGTSGASNSGTSSGAESEEFMWEGTIEIKTKDPQASTTTRHAHRGTSPSGTKDDEPTLEGTIEINTEPLQASAATTSAASGKVAEGMRSSLMADLWWLQPADVRRLPVQPELGQAAAADVLSAVMPSPSDAAAGETEHLISRPMAGPDQGAASRTLTDELVSRQDPSPAAAVLQPSTAMASTSAAADGEAARMSSGSTTGPGAAAMRQLEFKQSPSHVADAPGRSIATSSASLGAATGNDGISLSVESGAAETLAAQPAQGPSHAAATDSTSAVAAEGAEGSNLSSTTVPGALASGQTDPEQDPPHIAAARAQESSRTDPHSITEGDIQAATTSASQPQGTDLRGALRAAVGSPPPQWNSCGILCTCFPLLCPCLHWR